MSKRGTPKGAEHAPGSRAWLTEEDVRTMRTEHASGAASYATLAIRFGLTRDAVKKIVTRRRWKHVA